ncbi:MAG: SDR family NAD(P)-dependent oxidoreductase [Gemmatimonadaceae bacterium]
MTKSPGPESPAASSTSESEEPVALVTGARKGIGRHLAEHLLASGYRVVGCGRTAECWQAERFDYVQADVADEAQVLPLFRHISQTYGRLDVVINNAGLAFMNHSLLTPVSTVEKTFRTNVTGTFLVSREAAKIMRKRKLGRIVNVSSAVVPLRLAGESAYLASKSAVETLSQVMARELAELGITVNVVAPGPTATDMIRGVPAEKIAQLTEQFFIKRLTTVEDIANAVSFFLRPESSAVTGQVIYLNGVANG